MHEIELQCDTIRTVKYNVLQADSRCNEAIAFQDGGLNSGSSGEAEVLRKLLRREAIIPRAPSLGSTFVNYPRRADILISRRHPKRLLN